MGNPEWLKNAVFYEIYPQSYRDSNGDGIGDFPGMTGKLDYVRSLGCNAIWLNPCYESPFQDAGYDISNYYRVAPRYGTNADLKRYIDEAHARGIKVVLDLVAGHTSVECEWFKKSCQSERNEYSDYYIWTNEWCSSPKNCRSINGYAPRSGNFIINFFYCQPALNYGFHPVEDPSWQLPMDHPSVMKVREELRNIMKFYLDMGCDGFRVDMAGSLVRGRDSYEGLKILWHDYRSWMERNYPEAVLISEWSVPEKSINAGFHVDFLVHFGLPGYTSLFRQELERVPNSPYAGQGKKSYFDRAGEGDAELFFNEVIDQLDKMGGKGYMAIPTGNHDFGRIRQGRTLDELKVLYMAIFTFPGVPFLYYGDEIGMDYVQGLVSKEGGYNRTGARTPMLWDETEKAGFSTAEEKDFYLPLGKRSSGDSVAAQEKDPGSLLNFTRKLIAMRRKYPALGAEGEFHALFVRRNTYPMIFERKLGNERFVVIVNPCERASRGEFGVPGMDRAERMISFGSVELSCSGGATVVEAGGISGAVYRIIS